jgi:transcriptional regulator
MYLPSAFAESRPEKLHGLVKSHPFGTLIVPRPDGTLEISHQPFLVGADGMLRAHVARENPVVPLAMAGAAATVVFRGPNGYISPRWYASRAEVPTWSYAVAHAYGRLRALPPGPETRAHLTELAQRFEGMYPNAWTPADLPPDQFDSLEKRIVAFEVTVERWEGKWKLGQNRSLADRQGAIDGLRREGGEAGNALADAMSAALPDAPPA